MNHCCDQMREALKQDCPQHRWPRVVCPERQIDYNERFDEYGLTVNDGGSSSVVIHFCPWCGAALPESQRDRWFDELEAAGFSVSVGTDLTRLPVAYRSGAWRQKPAEGVAPEETAPAEEAPAAAKTGIDIGPHRHRFHKSGECVHCKEHWVDIAARGEDPFANADPEIED